MARTLWSGSLSFGLVNVPVALFSGVNDTDVHFRQLHAKDHTPIEVHRFCAEEDVEVGYEEIASGYEPGDGSSSLSGTLTVWPLRLRLTICLSRFS